MIKIYPSDCYYNLCVQGFLELLKYGLGNNDVRKLLKNDGTIEIPDKIVDYIYEESSSPFVKSDKVKNITKWWILKTIDLFTEEEKKESLKKLRSFLFLKDSYYPSIIHESKIKDPTAFCINTDKLFTPPSIVSSTEHNAVNCVKCGKTFKINESEVYYRTFFTRSVSIFLGVSYNKAINITGWFGFPQDPVCPFCLSIMLCLHLVTGISGGLFYDFGCFRINNDIYELVQNDFGGQKPIFKSNIKKMFSFVYKPLIKWQPNQNYSLIFSKINGKNKQLQRYIISETSVKWLTKNNFKGLNILNKLQKSADYKLLDIIANIIVNEEPQLLLTNAFKLLRNSSQQKNNYSPENHEVTLELLKLFSLYPQQPEKRRKSFMGQLSIIEEFFNCGNNASDPFVQKKNNNLIYKILDLTNRNDKNAVYYLLLREYIGNEQKFQECFRKLFEIDNDDDFKKIMFAYIAGVINQKGRLEAYENEKK